MSTNRLNNIELLIDFTYELETNNILHLLDILLINNYKLEVSFAIQWAIIPLLVYKYTVYLCFSSLCVCVGP